jgi:predicted nucleic acid-binding protein
MQPARSGVPEGQQRMGDWLVLRSFLNKMSAIVNATPLIALALVDRLDLLQKLFGEVIVPQRVYAEATSRGRDRPGAQAIAQLEWLQIVPVKTAVLATFIIHRRNNTWG